MRKSGSKERSIASMGASVGASLGARTGPFGAGIGAGFGGAVGYVAGALLPSCGRRSAMTDGGHEGTRRRGERRRSDGRRPRDRAGDDAGAVAIPVEKE